MDITTVTAGVATLLVGQLAIAPAVAGIVASIVVGKVAPNSVEALCKAWTAKLGPVPAARDTAHARTDRAARPRLTAPRDQVRVSSRRYRKMQNGVTAMARRCHTA